MKNYIKAFAVLSILGGAAQLSAAGTHPSKVERASEQKTVILDVPGMFCATCPFTVRKSLQKLEGVTSVKTDLESKTAIVTYDPKKVDIKKLITTTTNVGYPATVKNKG